MFDLMPFGRRDKNLMRAFDDFDRNFFGDFPDMSKAFAGFRTDVLDKGDRYILEAELPGFEKEDIHIDIDGDYLTVRAEHNGETKEERKDFVRRERHYGSYARSFDISDVCEDKITASYKNGILTLTLPKQEGKKKETKSISID